METIGSHTTSSSALTEEAEKFHKEMEKKLIGFGAFLSR